MLRNLFLTLFSLFNTKSFMSFKPNFPLTHFHTIKTLYHLWFRVIFSFLHPLPFLLLLLL